MADLPPELHDRYGLDRNPAKTIGYLLTIAAALIAALILASQLIGRAPTIQLINTGHKPLSNAEVLITYTVHGKVGVELECSATAVNDNFAEVGAQRWTWVMEEDSVSGELTLSTSEQAASGSIEYCVPVS